MPRHDADRNLLFGINALQNDFITRDALIAALNAWVLEKHRPLGEILVERGDLDPAGRALLDQLLDHHLARHGGDPTASLAAMSSIESVAADLRRTVSDPDVLESIAQVSTEPPAEPDANRAVETAVYVPAGVRYRKVRDHAEGGLGIVYVARDEELNREVALKEIKPKYADNLASQSRFLIEAEITGGLEHPGIVPVYGLGHYDDGRLYYAMRFIRGNSLRDAIQAFHADATLKNDPGARTLALQKLLRRFLDVCNAIAYAHNRGVLHRDLKPDNVMVGKYGETLVVDWGLAKTVARSGDDTNGELPESTIRPASSSGSAETLPGTVVGTPAYMSPEQAAGRLDLLGPASDVYGLGATLYSLLTGRAPFADKDLNEVLRKVERGEFARPRESAPWLDPALEAICLKAMALRPESRYASPRALADDIERWIADEPVAAYPEPLARRARRWARRHRTSLATATVAATVAALLIGGFAWQRFEQRRRTDRGARSILDRAEYLATQARASGDLTTWDAAVAEVLRARERLDSGDGSLELGLEANRLLASYRADRSLQARDRQVVDALEDARLRGADVKDGRFDLQAKDDAYLAAFKAHGIDLATLPVEDAARLVRSSRVGDELIEALDDWSRYSRTVTVERASAIARAAETDPVRASVREASSRRDAAALRRYAESEEGRRNLGPRLRHVFNSLLRIDPEGSFPLLETILREHPSDFWLNQDLGLACRDARPPKLAEAVRYLSVAVALRPGSPGAHLNLGNALKAQGQLGPAIDEFRAAIRIKPDYAAAHFNLGLAMKDRGQLDQAVAEFRAAIRLKPDFPAAHTTLGVCLRDRGEIDQAIAEYREAIRIDPDYAMAHFDLGIALKARRQLDQAIDEYREAIRINPDYTEAHSELGNALRGRGRLDQAVDEYRAAIRLNPDYAEAHVNLGLALRDQGQIGPAIEECRAAIRIKPELANAHSILGLALRDQGRLDQAIDEFREAIRLKPDAEFHVNLAVGLRDRGQLDQAMDELREAIRLKPELAVAHYNLGLALFARGQFDQAIDELRDAIRIEPDYADAHMNLGNALKARGQLGQSIDEYRATIRIKPGFAAAHYNLGNALRDRGEIDRALAEYREAIRIKPDFAAAHASLGNILRGRGQLDQAIAELREAIRLKPDHAEAHCDLGLCLLQAGRFGEALESLEKGHALGSKRPGWRNPSEAWVRDARRLVDLEAKLPAIRKGEATPKDPAERLALADLCYKTGRYATSTQFWAEAFAETPALADDLAKGNRYNAACSASLAASGRGKDEPMPDEPAKAKLREQALAWLRADLVVWGRLLDRAGEPARKQAVARTLIHWKEDSDLAGIRDEAALAKLPDGEREGFRELWVEVDRLLAKARAGAP